MIVALVGPSGSGKTECCMACERLGIQRVITNTTRERRVSDKPDAYHFRTLEEFKKLIRKATFLTSDEDKLFNLIPDEKWKNIFIKNFEVNELFLAIGSLDLRVDSLCNKDFDILLKKDICLS